MVDLDILENRLPIRAIQELRAKWFENAARKMVLERRDQEEIELPRIEPQWQSCLPLHIFYKSIYPVTISREPRQKKPTHVFSYNPFNSSHNYNPYRVPGAIMGEKDMANSVSKKRYRASIACSGCRARRTKVALARELHLLNRLENWLRSTKFSV